MVVALEYHPLAAMVVAEKQLFQMGLAMMYEKEYHSLVALEKHKHRRRMFVKWSRNYFLQVGLAMMYEKEYHPLVAVGKNKCLLYTTDAAGEEDSVEIGGGAVILKKKKEKE